MVENRVGRDWGDRYEHIWGGGGQVGVTGECIGGWWLRGNVF